MNTLNLTELTAARDTDTTPLGLLMLSLDPFTQGSRAARQPWAKLDNRFAVQITFRLVQSFLKFIGQVQRN